MENPFNDWNSYRDILDEILYRDPEGLIRQLDIKDGATRMIEEITFADGSKLSVAAQVPLPPLNDMTPVQVNYLKLNGERGQKYDDGLSEAMCLARQTIAIRFLEQISKILDKIPVCEKMICPSCEGERECPYCQGQGCPECHGSGLCPDCKGHGQIAKE